MNVKGKSEREYGEGGGAGEAHAHRKTEREGKSGEERKGCPHLPYLS